MALFIIIFNIYSYQNRLFHEKFQASPWREAVNQFEKLCKEEDVILVQDPFQSMSFLYYYKGSLPSYTIMPQNVPQDIQAISKAHGRIWLFRCQHWHSDPKELVQQWLRKNCETKELFIYPRVDRASLLTVELFEYSGPKH